MKAAVTFRRHTNEDRKMSRKIDIKILGRVFSDAHVIDIDFSSWDKHVSLLVLSDHYEAWSDRCPVVLIELRNIREFAFRMPQAEIGWTNRRGTFQWKIDDFEIQELNSAIRLRLFGSPSSPVLNVECEGIEIRPIPARILDESFPGWNRPFAGLVRQSVENIAKSFHENKRGHGGS